MNFIEAYKLGQEGKSKGLPLGEGLEEVSRAINGLQKAMIIGVAASPKVGKSTLVDAGFVIGPILYALEHNITVHYTYFSYEIDRITKEFDFAAYFFAEDFKISRVTLPEGVTLKGKQIIELSADYLLGKLQDDQERTILVSPENKEKLQVIYDTRISKIFGRFATDGSQIESGIINFIEEKDNPTGVRNYILSYAKKYGEFKHLNFRTDESKTGKRIIGYNSHNPDAYHVFITDHLRKLIPERGFQIKQTVDKMIEYQVELRNWCKFSFIDVIHLNRSMADIQRAKFMGDMLYPNSDDIKDTGNLSEEANHLFTMFNPNDDKYNLKKHFGEPIRDNHGNELYPRMRTLHLVESRHVQYPQHFRLNMYGHVKHFEQLTIKE